MKISADWLTAPATLAVMAALEGNAHFVGGCVRNALLGEPVHDIDLATPLQPDQVMHRVEANPALRAIPTGIDHGTVTVIAGGQPFEVTTYRADVETDGRHAIVRFTTDMAEDAARRDFTINALYATADGDVIDLLGGLPDLEERRIRFINRAEDRIREDALRILRFFRFSAWYADSIEAEGLAACADLAELVDGLASERVGAETRRLLAAPDPGMAVAAMATSGVLAHVVKGANIIALPPLIAREAAVGVEPDWRRRLASLQSAGVASALRLSNAEASHVAGIAKLLDAPLPPAIAAVEAGRDIALSAQLIQTSLDNQPWEPIASEIDRGAAACFPLQAGDLLAAGLQPGPDLGERLKRARQAWIDSDLGLDQVALARIALAQEG